MNIWESLGIEPTNDQKAIKKAYALKTRECHPEDDPEGFQRLHEAYQRAIAMAKAGPPQPQLEATEPQTPFDIETLIERGLRRKREEREEKRGTVLAAFEALAAGERRGERKAWAEALASLEFEEVRDDPELIEQLCGFLLAHKDLSASVWMEFYYAYDLVSPVNAYARLYEVLAPRCRQYEIRLAEEQKREKRRIYVGTVLVFLSVIGALYLLSIGKGAILIPILAIAAWLLLAAKFKLYKWFLALPLIAQAVCLAAGWTATVAVCCSHWFLPLLRSAPIAVGGVFCLLVISLAGLSLFFLAEFGEAVRDKW